jgi:hypothetical protein
MTLPSPPSSPHPAPDESLVGDRRVLSGRLFGRGAFLPVAAWIRGREGSWYQGQISRDLGLHATAVAVELALLAELEMLTRLERQPGDPRQLFTATEHPLWAVIDAAEAALAPPAADDSDASTEVTAHEPAPRGHQDASSIEIEPDPAVDQETAVPPPDAVVAAPGEPASTTAP